MTADTEAHRGVRNVRVLFGAERFSSQHSWSELTALMPGALEATVDVQWCPPGAFAERARNELIDVVVPLWSELDGETTRYFRRAARALGEALAAQLDGRPPPGVLNAHAPGGRRVGRAVARDR
jgi:hypothetical protein